MSNTSRPVRILTFTTLYPNAAMPRHGVFVENRLRHVLATKMVEARVVAPVPWFPLRHSRFGSYAQWALVPHTETRYGVPILHPRYPLAPKVGMTLAPYLLYRATLGPVRKIIEEGFDFDVIDAHYFYPDGVAAALLAKTLRKPFTITARGTDLNLIPQYLLPRQMIRWAADRADALICVCQALADVLTELGVTSEKINVLRNGVDLQLFRPPESRTLARTRFGIEQPTLISVGHLVERKGHDLVIRAMVDLPGMNLLIAGEGERRAQLEHLIAALGLRDRVRLIGAIPHDELPALYGAADGLVLASSREGWANVLLEAMACGTPVVASAIWGTPEVVATPAAGVLIEGRSPRAIVEGVRKLLSAPPDRALTRHYAEGFSWDSTTDGQIALFADLARRSSSPSKSVA